MSIIKNTLGAIGFVFGLAAVGEGALRTMEEPPENRNLKVFATHTWYAVGDLAVGSIHGIVGAIDKATDPNSNGQNGHNSNGSSLFRHDL